MRWSALFILLSLLTTSVANAQSTRPTSLPSSPPISRAQLDQMYRTELGRLYRPADADKFNRAGELIEHYFDVSAERPKTVKAIEAIGLDPNIVGRLVRIRRDWPALSPGVYYINEKLGPNPVRYFVGIPKTYDRTKAWPLVVKLPNADAFVTEPRPDPAQVTEIYSTWIADELKQHPDAIVLMPLLNLDDLWGPSYAGMNSVILPIHHIADRANIDPARVYIVGHSMSANAAWNFAMHYTTYFAAFHAMAGGAKLDWQQLRVMNLRNVLPVVWHDADDPALGVEAARVLVTGLRTQKIPVEYEETKAIGHTPTAEIVERGYQTVRKHTRTLYPKQVSLQSNRPDTIFNRNDWIQLYQPLNAGGDRRVIFSQGSGYMMLFTNAFMADATLDSNTINLTTRNVQSIRLYVNDQMIDFGRAVSVVVNRRPKFEAILKPGIEEMLKDQLFLGRGWRYYTAVIDLDLAATPARGTRSQ